MTPIHEQVAHIQQQIDALTEQVARLAQQSKRDAPDTNQPGKSDQKAGINRYRALPGKA